MNVSTHIVNILDQHNHILWDVDGTLINGPYSSLFSAYINRTSISIVHSIATFREEPYASRVMSDLEYVNLKKNDFNHFIHAPNGLNYNNYCLITGSIKCPLNEWKAYWAKEIGATILVDDMIHLCHPGCRKFGINLLDSTSLRLF